MAEAVKSIFSKNHLHVLIMAGGSGTRFWPVSRAKKPKQFLKLWGDKTLLEHTVDRFSDVVSSDNTWIVTNESFVAQSKEILNPKHQGLHYLGEPQSKNTASCILWGIREIHRKDPNATVVVMAADSYIGDVEIFLQALAAAAEISLATDNLLTLGVKPVRPETGYGYIEVETTFSGEKIGKPLTVKKFIEKPDLRNALRYMESGKYLWNAGMFIFAAKTGLNAFERAMPELYELFQTGDSIESIYSKIRPEDAVSIDYGVMEMAATHAIGISVLPVDCGWNDVGSFPALEEINADVQGQVVTHDSACNIVHSDSGIVTLLGVNDLVVVRDREVVLVAAKDRAQDIKLLLEKVRKRHPDVL